MNTLKLVTIKRIVVGIAFNDVDPRVFPLLIW